MSRADLEAAAEEKYPLAEGYGPTFNRVRRKQRAAYIRGRLDQAEEDARIAEGNPGIEEGYGVAHAIRIAAAIRKGVQ